MALASQRLSFLGSARPGEAPLQKARLAVAIVNRTSGPGHCRAHISLWAQLALAIERAGHWGSRV